MDKMPFNERFVYLLLRQKRLRQAGINTAHFLNTRYPFKWGQRLVIRKVNLNTNLGYRIVLLGDIHGDPKSIDETMIESIGAHLRSIENVSFFAFVGDFVNDQELAMITPIAEMIKTLQAQSFAVLGNHDHRAGARAITKSLQNSGATVLNNASIDYDDQLHIVGIDSWSENKDNIKKAFSNAPQHKRTLVLGHEPYLATMHDKWLHLAGHTHHGQIRIPGIRKVFAAPRGSYPYPAGLYRLKNRFVYTTSGIGYSLFPLRIGSRPEIVILDI